MIDARCDDLKMNKYILSSICDLFLFSSILGQHNQVFAYIPPPSTTEIEVTKEEAEVIANDILGLKISKMEETQKGFIFSTSGFKDDRRCPLKQIRDVKCEDDYTPTMVTIYRYSLVAPVSGHLSMNRLVVTDMFSEDVPLAVSGLHGVLVFPKKEVTKSAFPSMLLYRTRMGQSVGISTLDVDSDSVADVIYTYESQYAGQTKIVARDIWKVVDMKPEKMLSSGEQAGGPIMVLFDGVPLHADSETFMSRGRLSVEPNFRTQTPIIIFERAIFGMQYVNWELRVIVRIEEDWQEVIIGTGNQSEMNSCEPLDIPVTLPLEVRQRLLDLEKICYIMLEGSGILDGVLKGLTLENKGFYLLASVKFEEASRLILKKGFSLWFLSLLLSYKAVSHAFRSYSETFDGHLSLGTETDQWFSYFPIIDLTNQVLRRFIDRIKGMIHLFKGYGVSYSHFSPMLSRYLLASSA